MTRYRVSCLLLVALALADRASGDDPPPAAPPGRLSPAKALERLKEGNARFAADKAAPRVVDAKARARLAKGQEPFAVVLACADSRVPPELLFDQGLGDLFVVRVAGNVTGVNVLGSIEYAVEHLHVPLVVVLGHEDCGAVKAALDEHDAEGNLGLLLRDIHPGKGLPAARDQAVAAAVKANVRFHARELVRRSAVLKDFVHARRVRVVSGVYSMTTGEVEWLGWLEPKAPPR